MSELQLSLAPVAKGELELVDAEFVSSPGAVASASVLSPSPPPVAPALAERNLFGEAERIAARAATATRAGSTARSFTLSGTGWPASWSARRW